MLFMIDYCFDDVFIFIEIRVEIYQKKYKKEELKFMCFRFTSLSLDGYAEYLCWGALNAIGKILQE